MTVWKPLPLSNAAQVNLRGTLCGGQCFRWTMTRFGTFVGVVQDRAYELRPVKMDIRGNSTLQFRRLDDKTPTTKPRGKQPGRARSVSLSDEAVLSSYLALDVDLGKLWTRWSDDNPQRKHPLVQFLLHDVGWSALSASEQDEPAIDTGGTTSTAAPVFLNTEFLPFDMLRVLRQDLHQTVYEFLCSQNNHVKRITSLVQTLCTTCGDHICDYDLARGDVATPASEGRTSTAAAAAAAGSSRSTTILPLHAFPTIDQLSTLSEQTLRELGFGYRAKYIAETTRLIRAARTDPTFTSVTPVQKTAPTAWPQHAESQHEPFYQAIFSARDACGGDAVAAQRAMRERLLALPGVGRKVADCVLLFSLDQHDLVPADTHMVQVALRYLSPSVNRTTSKGSTGRKRQRAESLPAQQTQWETVLQAWKAKETKAVTAAAADKKGRGSANGASAKGKPTKATVPALGEAQHDAIQDGFRDLFGPYCGWAHCNIFYVVSSTVVKR